MSSKLRTRAEKIRSAIIEHARKIDRKRSRAQSRPDEGIHVYGPSCYWHKLPVELTIRIFSQCCPTDLINLQRVCRAFHGIVTTNEQIISRELLRLQRHGTLPSPIEDGRAHSRDPEDIMILISDLFPPAKGGYKIDLYSFRYLYSLQRRLRVCEKLSYYLADQMLNRYLHDGPPSRSSFATRNDRKVSLQIATNLLQLKLTPLLIYAHFFLETYSQARANLENTLNMDYDAGRLPVPIQPRDRSRIYHRLQNEILESPPFTNASTLISTHHCMLLLVSYLRYNITHSSEKWISMMLISSGLARIVELFAAEKGDEGNRRQKRKQFMQDMQMDWIANEREEQASKIFASDGQENSYPPRVPEIWLEAADYQIRSRALTHKITDSVVIWNDIKLNMACHYCMGHSDDFLI